MGRHTEPQIFGGDRSSLSHCFPGWTQICHPITSACRVLGLQVCTPILGSADCCFRISRKYLSILYVCTSNRCFHRAFQENGSFFVLVMSAVISHFFKKPLQLNYSGDPKTFKFFPIDVSPLSFPCYKVLYLS